MAGAQQAGGGYAVILGAAPERNMSDKTAETPVPAVGGGPAGLACPANFGWSDSRRGRRARRPGAGEERAAQWLTVPATAASAASATTEAAAAPAKAAATEAAAEAATAKAVAVAVADPVIRIAITITVGIAV